MVKGHLWLAEVFDGEVRGVIMRQRSSAELLGRVAVKTVMILVACQENEREAC